MNLISSSASIVVSEDAKWLSLARKTAKGGLLLLSGDLYARFVMFIAMIVIARLLGPSDYGLYVLSFVIPYLFVPLCNLGLNHALLYFPGKLRSRGDEESVPIFVGTGLVIRASTAFLAFLICYSAADFLAVQILGREELAVFLRIISPFILFQSLFAIFYHSFTGLGEPSKSTFLRILYASLKALFATSLVLLGLGVGGALFGFVLASLFTSLAGFLFLIAKFGRHSFAFSLSVAKELMSYGWLAYASLLVSAFATQYQYILLAFFASDVEVGNFGVAQKFSQAFVLVSAPLTMVMIPAFSELDLSKDRAQVRKLFGLFVKYHSIIILPLAALSIILARDIVRVLYGRQYSLAPLYLSLLAANFIYSCVGYKVLEAFFNGIGEPKETLFMMLTYCASIFTIGTFLAQSYGVLGVLVAILISNASLVSYGLLKARRREVSIRIRDEAGIVAAVTASSCLAYALLWILPSGSSFFSSLVNLLITTPFFLFCYASFLPILKGVGPRDVEWLRDFFERFGPLARPLSILLMYEERLVRFLSK